MTNVMAALFLAVIVKRVPLPGEPTGVTKGRPAASDIPPGGQSMASLDDRRPSHDIVQDDIVGTLTVDVCSLPYFTANRLLVTRVHPDNRGGQPSPFSDRRFRRRDWCRQYATSYSIFEQVFR